jgi:hypothetical protein
MRKFFSDLPAVRIPLSSTGTGYAYYDLDFAPEGSAYTQVYGGETIYHTPVLNYRVKLKCDPLLPNTTPEELWISGVFPSSTPQITDTWMPLGSTGCHLWGIRFYYTGFQAGEAVADATQSLYTLCNGGTKAGMYDASSAADFSFQQAALWKNDMTAYCSVYFTKAKITVTAP